MTEPQTIPQERADEAAKNLITAVADMAVLGDSELVILMRGHVEGIPGNGTADVLYSWEWFCRPEDRSPQDAAPEDDPRGR